MLRVNHDINAIKYFNRLTALIICIYVFIFDLSIWTSNVGRTFRVHCYCENRNFGYLFIQTAYEA